MPLALVTAVLVISPEFIILSTDAPLYTDIPLDLL